MITFQTVVLAKLQNDVDFVLVLEHIVEVANVLVIQRSLWLR